MAIPTAKETAFLTKLRSTLTAADVNQQAVYDAMLREVEADMAKEGELALADVFTAMQRAVKNYHAEMDIIVAQNNADFKVAYAKLNNKKDKELYPENEDKTHTILIKGFDELTAKGNALAAATSQEKIQQVIDDGVGAGLDYAPETKLDLDTDYPKKTLYTEAKSTGSNVNIKGVRQTEPVAGQGTLSKIRKYQIAGKGLKLQANESSFIIRDDRFPDNDQSEGDRISLIAEAWVRKYNTKEGFKLPDFEGKAQPRLLPANSGGKNFMKNVQAVTLWLADRNNLKDAWGKECDNKSYGGPIIHVGEQIILPGGNDIAPRQTYFVCAACEVKVEGITKDYALDHEVGGVTPKPTQITPRYTAFQSTPATNGRYWTTHSANWSAETVAQMGVDDRYSIDYYNDELAPRKPESKEKHTGEIKRFDRWGKHPFWQENKHSKGNNQYAHRDDANGSKTEVGRWVDGDRGHVNRGGYIDLFVTPVTLKTVQDIQSGNITAETVKQAELHFADIIDKDKLTLMRGYVDGTVGKEALAKTKILPDYIRSASDRGLVIVDKKDDKRGEKNDIETLVPVNSQLRHNGAEVSTYWNDNRAVTVSTPLIGKNWVIPWVPGGGVAVSNPTKEIALQVSTGLSGMPQANQAISQLNKLGKSGRFTDEQAYNTAPFSDADRQIMRAMELNANRTIPGNANVLFDQASTEEQKKKAGTNILIALRDMHENKLIRQNGALDVEFEASANAVRNYASSVGITLPTADELTDHQTHPYIRPHMMNRELLEQLRGHISTPNKFAMIERYLDKNNQGIEHPQADAIIAKVYGPQQRYELRIAQANDKVNSTEDAMALARTTWESILYRGDDYNRDAVRSYADFIDRDFNAQMATGAWLNDMHRNPQNYFPGDEKESRKKVKDTIKALLNNDARAIEDVTERGGSSPIWFARDSDFALARPEQFGIHLAQGIRNNPEWFAQVMTIANADDATKQKDGKGKTDGNPFMIGMLAAYGRHVAAPDAVDGGEIPPLADLKSHLGDKAEEVDNNIWHTFHYSENEVAGTSIQDRERGQNTLQKAQLDWKAGKPVDLAKLYRDLHLSTIGASEVGTIGVLNTKPILIEDAMFVAIMRNPDAFDAVIKDMRAYSRGKTDDIAGEERTNRLIGVMNSTQAYGRKFEKAGTDKERAHIIEEAGKTWKSFDVDMDHMEDKVERAADKGKYRQSGERLVRLYAQAKEAMVHSAAKNPAASLAVMQAVFSDDRMMNAALSTSGAGYTFTDAVQLSYRGGEQLAHTDDNRVYGLDNSNSSLFFTTPTKTHTKIDGTQVTKVKPNKGLFGLGGRRDVEVQVDALMPLIMKSTITSQQHQAQETVVDIGNGMTLKTFTDGKADLIVSYQENGKTKQEVVKDVFAKTQEGFVQGDVTEQTLPNGMVLEKAVGSDLATLVNNGQRLELKPKVTTTPLAPQVAYAPRTFEVANGVKLETGQDGKTALVVTYQQDGENRQQVINDVFAEQTTTQDIPLGNGMVLERVKGSPVAVLIQPNGNRLILESQMVNPLGLAPEALQQVHALPTGFLQDMKTAQVLHTDTPRIVPPDVVTKLSKTKDAKLQRQIKVDALTTMLTDEGRPLPLNETTQQQMTAQELATMMVDEKLVNFVSNGQQLIITPTSQMLLNTKQSNEDMSKDRGLIPLFILGFLGFARHTTTTITTHVIEIPICNCPPPLLGAQLQR